MKKCPICGVEFQPKNPKGKFCSAKCRLKSSRIKKDTFAGLTPEEIVDAYVIPQKLTKAQKLESDNQLAEARKNSMANFFGDLPARDAGLSKYDQERRMKKLGF